MTATHPKLTGKLLIETAVGNFLGDKRIRLLEAVDRHGSISQAARTVPLSYKAAWDALDDMNNLAAEPLIRRSTGGRHGGGTELTDFGRRLIAFYRALEQEYQVAVERLSGDLERGEAVGVAGFRLLLKRMSLKTSARNQFAGPVVGVKQGVIDSEVTIGLGPGLELAATVTRESAENLGLAVGRDILALVKASSVNLLAADDGRIPAPNRFRGRIANFHEGPVNAEVTLELYDSRHVITSVITHESAGRLGLAIGRPAIAAFEASSVLLTSFG